MSNEEHLDRLEARIAEMQAALVRMTKATEEGFTGVTAQLGVIRATLDLLNKRMDLLEGQMTEVLGRLRIIGEQLAAHISDGHGHEAA